MLTQSKKYIPGPITQEKLEACELTSEPKRNLNQLVKNERKDTKKIDQVCSSIIFSFD